MKIEGILASIPNMSAEQRRQVRANAEKHLANPAMEANARRVLEALDQQAETEESALIEHVRGLSKSQRIVEAFRHDLMTETERRLVSVLLDNPGQSSEGLSKAMGWGGQTWHMHFGEMCKRREARLWPAKRSETSDAAFYSGILAEWTAETGWNLKPEAVEAFKVLGLKAKELKPA